MKKDIKIVKLTDEQFSNFRTEWQELLTGTTSDQLFLSWFWMHQWWTQCSDSSTDELLLLAAYDENKLVGIAPFYKSKQKLKHLLSSTRVLFIGTNPVGHSAFRAEYLEIIVHQGYENIIEKFYDYLDSNIRFSEIYLQDVIYNSPSFKYLNSINGYRRQRKIGETFSIDTTATFKDYLSNLGSKRRLKCYNHRKKLEKKCELEVHELKQGQLTLLFEQLFELQKGRWDVDVDELKLKQMFIENLIAQSPIEICGVIIYCDKKPIACTLNLKYLGRVYGFQLAYKHGFDNQLSLGLLTIVYDAEQYFKDEEIEYFDLLEGSGKTYNYKSHLASKEKELVTVTAIKSPLLSQLFRSYDVIKKVRHSLRKN